MIEWSDLDYECYEAVLSRSVTRSFIPQRRDFGRK